MYEKRVMEMIYKKAERPEDLPWHTPEPYDLVLEAAKAHDYMGKALDLGCGTGVVAVALAEMGFEVTAIDFIPKAIEMARTRAADDGVEVDFIERNLLEWEGHDVFDLIHDSGTLHSMPSSRMAGYKEKLLSWSKAGTDFVIAHWGKRHALDWRPIGPNRRSRESLVEFFAPEFEEKDYVADLMEGVPLPFGPKVLGQSFWFVRV